MGDVVEVDLDSGKIKNLTNGKTFTAKPYRISWRVSLMPAG